MKWALIVAVACLQLAACGKREQPQVPADETNMTVTGQPKDGSDKAPSLMAKAECALLPKHVTPKGQQADDILGLRLGMSVKDARTILLCTDPRYKIVESDSEYDLDGGAMDNGLRAPIKELNVRLNYDRQGPRQDEDEIGLVFAGPPGAEQAISVRRRIYPVTPYQLEQIRADFVTKYGKMDELDSGHPTGHVVYLQSGDRISPQNSQYGSCVEATGDWHTTVRFAEFCGLTINYSIGTGGDGSQVNSIIVAIANPATAKLLLQEAGQRAKAVADKEVEARGTPML